MKIQSIVEGHGDVAALPVLLRRLVAEAGALAEAGVLAVGVGRPIRRPRHWLVREDGVRRAVRLALAQPDCGAVLVLLDGDADCPAELGPTVQAWATAAAGTCRAASSWRTGSTKHGFWPQSNRCAVGAPSGATRTLIRIPMKPRGAKEQLEARMRPGAIYLETLDQPAFSALFSLPCAYRRSRSFRKLADSFANLARAMGHEVGVWPPPAWTGA